VIVYASTKSAFLHTAFTGDIEDAILRAFRTRVGHGVSRHEVRSWKESLLAMAKVLNDEAIPADCGVAVEYGIPQTSKRIDVLLSGQDDAGRGNLIIVELKQWEHATRTPMDGVVRTRFAGGEADTSHPSYQSWSYAELLRNFNAAVDEGPIPLQPCAYLHNCRDGADLTHPSYAWYVERAPLFLAGDAERARLREFIARHVKRGDAGRLIYELENGRIRPSRRLIDALQGMMQGKREFVLVDDQKLVYETALARAAHAQTGTKQVVIVEGGPGTGKSVVAVNLLAALIHQGRNARYVSKNRAPVSAGVKLDHLAEVKVDHLGDDGGFLRAADADSGAVRGDSGVGTARDGDPGDCPGVGDPPRYGSAVPRGPGRRSVRAAVAAADQARSVPGVPAGADRGCASGVDPGDGARARAA
jgi:hypothetical protein